MIQYIHAIFFQCDGVPDCSGGEDERFCGGEGEDQDVGIVVEEEDEDGE